MEAPCCLLPQHGAVTTANAAVLMPLSRRWLAPSDDALNDPKHGAPLRLYRARCIRLRAEVRQLASLASANGRPDFLTTPNPRRSRSYPGRLVTKKYQKKKDFPNNA